jgi:release factor glutamine methyltransferase
VTQRREALARAAWRLRDAGVASPDHDAEAMLADLLDVPRLRLGLVDELTPTELKAFDAMVVRRARREPLQHILGHAAFRYVDVQVGPGVFVPRPETEALAGWAIDHLRHLPAIPPAPIAVELCAGSAAMALSLATEVSEVTVHAVEISDAAIAYATRNLNGSGVHLHHGDIASAVPSLDGSVDVVVANPPYIPLTAYDSVDAEARDYDPPLSLWAGGDGLDMVRQVEQVAARLLRAGGVVGCEHADVQAAAATAVFSRSGRWTGVRDRADLAGRPRFVTASRI